MMTFRKGFTLIELIVTMGIISLLAAAIVAVLRPMDYIMKSRDTRRMSDLKVIQTALEQFYGENSRYPSTAEINVASSNPFTYNSVTYLNVMPVDPAGSATPYCYFQGDCGGTASTAKYTLCAQLEASSGTSCPSACASRNYCMTNPF